ncbi:Polyketide cyclase / dehydrase and lipid transport [Chryseolinea serpens]|uniref:Polyketide cyclase / dehydrase and lipid transport n=1 Tax=Chryseolinea serpens TaxID=947013 RepID=A0A1M5TU10_9BACT|nr:SRPBCC family protein [Chryseolinea serpens]SHH54161.1 Polyketide cyclase / dehydrase and lipid transport [Chryseolinea serpens]
MKMIILKAFTILVAIVSMAAVIAMFSKNKYTLTRNIVINKAKEEVFAYIRLNRNQQAYSKWLALDPNTKIQFKGAADGTPGAILTFSSKSNKTGTGEWEIKNIVDGEKMDFELRFLAPFVFTANGTFLTQSIAEQQTKVTWTYNSGMDWPKNFMLLFMDMDKIVGNDIQESLVNVKNNLER